MAADLYDELKIDRSATPEQVRHSYLTLSRSLHPDKSINADPEAFRKVHNAYRVLSDPSLRSFYDKYGTEGIAVADEAVTADELRLLPADKRLPELERKVQNLVRTTTELKAQQALNVTGESSFGARILSFRPFYYRWNASSISQSVSFNAGDHTLTLASASHVQRGGAGAARLSFLYGYGISALSTLRVSCHFLGGNRSAEAHVERQLDDWNSARIGVGLANRKLEANALWKHVLSSSFTGALGVTIGARESVTIEISK